MIAWNLNIHSIAFTPQSHKEILLNVQVYIHLEVFGRGVHRKILEGGGRMWVILGGTTEASSRVERKAMSAWGPGD